MALSQTEGMCNAHTKKMKYIPLLFCLLFSAPIFSQDYDVIIPISPEIQDLIERGLEFLRSQQNIRGLKGEPCSNYIPDCVSGKMYGECCYGSWNSDIGYKLNHSYRKTEDEYPHIGVSALACLAFLANGNTPDRGEYALNLRAGLQYILNHTEVIGQRLDGSKTAFISHNGTRMYSHAFATLFLAEVYGMTHDESVREKLQQAVSLIEDCQNPKGGWRYQPYAQDADMSITVCQVQALRAARNAGIKVSKDTILKALGYVQKVANPQQQLFQYQDLAHSRESFALTAAGCTALHGVGYYNSRTIRPYLDRLRFMRNPYEGGSESYFYYYGHYYAAQAMFIEGGSYWEEWYKRISKEFLSRARTRIVKKPDGSEYESKYWHSTHVGPIYSTSMSLIVLQLPYKYLPILER